MSTGTPSSGERTHETFRVAPSDRACSTNREQVAYPIAVVRMMGLDTAAQLFGKGGLADELCITVRALNYKINGERGACDADIIAAARALEERAERLLAHAQKLRAVVSPAVSDRVTPKPLGQARIVIAHCDHVERFAYERHGTGLDASPHLLASAARTLALVTVRESTKTGNIAQPEGLA